AEELKIAEMAKLRHANKLYNEKIAQERREQRAKEKEEREQKAEEAAERKAQRERNKQARDAEKALKLPQRHNRKASAAPAARIPKKRCTMTTVRGVAAAEPPAAPRTHTTRSSRTATLYN
ncbi:uncharacterized protein M421DRAFT_51205, partial [Didymella exigua CBS 183.55]